MCIGSIKFELNHKELILFEQFIFFFFMVGCRRISLDLIESVGKHEEHGYQSYCSRRGISSLGFMNIGFGILIHWIDEVC